jgi:hypothetical protein
MDGRDWHCKGVMTDFHPRKRSSSSNSGDRRSCRARRSGFARAGGQHVCVTTDRRAFSYHSGGAIEEPDRRGREYRGPPMSTSRTALALLALTALGGLDLRPAAADNRPWCFQDTGKGATSCGFTSFGDRARSRRQLHAEPFVSAVRRARPGAPHESSRWDGRAVDARRTARFHA